MLSHLVCLFVTLWTVACQASLSKVFSRQEYWSGLPVLPPGNLPYSWIEPSPLCHLYWQVSSLPLVPPGKPIHALNKFKVFFFFNCDMKIVTLIAYIQLQAFQIPWVGKKISVVIFDFYNTKQCCLNFTFLSKYFKMV